MLRNNQLKLIIEPFLLRFLRTSAQVPEDFSVFLSGPRGRNILSGPTDFFGILKRTLPFFKRTSEHYLVVLPPSLNNCRFRFPRNNFDQIYIKIY